MPASELPTRLIDEFYCSNLNMDPDSDCDVDDDSDVDGVFIPYVPLTQRQIKESSQTSHFLTQDCSPKSCWIKYLLKIQCLESVRAQVEQHKR